MDDYVGWSGVVTAPVKILQFLWMCIKAVALFLWNCVVGFFRFIGMAFTALFAWIGSWDWEEIGDFFVELITFPFKVIGMIFEKLFDFVGWLFRFLWDAFKYVFKFAFAIITLKWLFNSLQTPQNKQ